MSVWEGQPPPVNMISISKMSEFDPRGVHIFQKPLRFKGVWIIQEVMPNRDIAPIFFFLLNLLFVQPQARLEVDFSLIITATTTKTLTQIF